jgi:hypothetical protein
MKAQSPGHLWLLFSAKSIGMAGHSRQAGVPGCDGVNRISPLRGAKAQAFDGDESPRISPYCTRPTAAAKRPNRKFGLRYSRFGVAPAMLVNGTGPAALRFGWRLTETCARIGHQQKAECDEDRNRDSDPIKAGQ